MSSTNSNQIGFFQSVKGRIFIFFLSLSLIPLIVTGGIVFWQSQQIIRADIEKEFTIVGSLQTAEIINWLAEREKDVLTLSGIARIQTMDATKACPAIQQYFTQWKIYQDIFLAQPDGSRLCDALGDTTSVADRAYFTQALQGQIVISDPLISKTTGTPIIVIAAPIQVNGETLGVIGLTVPTDYMSSLLKSSQSGRTREAYLLSREGYFITESRFTASLIEQGRVQKQSALELQIETVGSQKGLAGESGLAEYLGYNGKTVLGVYRPIPGLGAGAVLVLEEELDEVQATSNQLRNSVMLVAFFSGVVVVGLALVFGKTLTDPLLNLSAQLNLLALGNLDQKSAQAEMLKLTQRRDEYGVMSQALEKVKGYLLLIAETSIEIAHGDLSARVILSSDEDEIGNALSRMLTGLRELIGEVKENVVRLEAASNSLADTSTQAGKATSQIATTIQQVAQGINQQTEAVTRTAASAEQMTQALQDVASGAQAQANAVDQASRLTAQITLAIQQVASNAQTSARGASEAAVSARNGTQTVAETIQSIQSIKVKVGQSAEKVQEMGQRSDQIGEIVATIDEIASQTNLLALNAAIEAARAGEQGKGFAVVAEEVRKLADRSSQATKEIGTLIVGIQKTVSEAVSAMEAGAREVEHGVVRANQAGEALQSIFSAVEVVNRQVDEIAGSAQQINLSSHDLGAAMSSVSEVVQKNLSSTATMSSNSQIVAQAVESIASVSEENSAAVEQVSASTEEMNAQVDEVGASAKALARLAQSLQAVVTRFKLED
jgi:methyl-accepting chemotaxis protein